MRQRKHEPRLGSLSGLVPMADMLSNTVGIMLFILAFTVLQSGGALVPKRLPMEKEGDASPVYWVCKNGRLMPLDGDLSDKLFEGLGEPTYDTAQEWVNRFNSKAIEDDYFQVSPDGSARFNRGAFESSVRLVLSAEYTPKENSGDSIDDVGLESSIFSKSLSAIQTNEHFVYFFVYPDSIELFRTARNHAKTQYGLSSGWGPMGAEEAIRFSLAGGRGGGIVPTAQ